jgi:hypothetical protein
VSANGGDEKCGLYETLVGSYGAKCVDKWIVGHLITMYQLPRLFNDDGYAEFYCNLNTGSVVMERSG